MSQAIQTSAKKITVLGTGIMGAAIARNLRKKGFIVSVWNRTYEKAKALAEFGITVHEQVQEAVGGADIILTMLKDGSAISEVMDSALLGLSKGTIWIQASTVGIAANEQLEAIAAENDLTYFDAPVQGTRGPAELGKLIIIASGPLFGRHIVQSVFDAIGQRTVWVSEQSGMSSRLKLALNSWAFALTHGIAESLSIAESLGIEPSLVIDVVKDGPMDSLYFQLKSAAIMAGNYDPSFSLDNAIKDAELIVEASKRVGVKVDSVEAGLKRWKRAQQAGHGSKDMAATYFAKSL